MANDEHVAILKKGVDAWNAWREAKPDIRPDLLRADLAERDLRKANLRGAILSHADLTKANLEEANLEEASLEEAKLEETNLRGAILKGADLTGANLNKASLSTADTTLSTADLRKAKLIRVNLSKANLSRTNLSGANLFKANLSGANLHWADLTGADIYHADLTGANLGHANLTGAGFGGADLTGANLGDADLTGANLGQAGLKDANLSCANLNGANLNRALLHAADLRFAKLIDVNLSGANLSEAQLVDTDLTGADLTGCCIFGISAWRLKLERAKQQSLVITPKPYSLVSTPYEPEITVDNIEVAQFVYLMLHNQKIRDVIDTITSKAVLILGRFTDERKAVLDALREELRKHNYLPILFDFDVPATRDITETVSLARMARFIIADLTDPSSIPKELEAIVPGLAVPVQPLLEGASRPYAMFKDYWKYDWVLPIYRYEGLEPLLAMLAEKVIAPAEGKVKALEERRRTIEAELTKPL